MKKTRIIPALMSLSFLLLLVSCKKDDPDTSGDIPWALPLSQVVDGGPGKDGIPSIDDPKFSDAGAIDFLEPMDLVLGIKIGNEIRAYPHPIMDQHEIVNDNVNGVPLAITYCPLTGTGSAWNRAIDGNVTTFGVSGLLYNANLLPYDRATNSAWSQMLLKGVSSTQINKPVETYPMVEMRWDTWKAMFPNSKVLNTETGFNRHYGEYPYGDYRTDHDLMVFPVTPDDSRMPRKRRGLGVIIDGEAKFYPYSQFSSQVVVHADDFKGEELVIVGSILQNFIVAYSRQLADGTLLDFEAIDTPGSATVMRDNEGTEWNVFGAAVAGPRQGAQLKAAEGFVGYWFAWGAFYPGLEIF